jgi:hypothetical protein
MPEPSVVDQSKPQRCPRLKRLPSGPDDEAQRWQPPGMRKDRTPQPVPRAVRRDNRQEWLDLDGGLPPQAGAGGDA